MRVLILGNLSSHIVSSFAEGLMKKGETVHILDHDELVYFDPQTKTEKRRIHIPKYIKKSQLLSYLVGIYFISSTLKKLSCKYDICHIHFVYSKYAFVTKSIEKAAFKLVVSVYGSDFYRQSNIRRKIRTKIFKKADKITFINEEMIKDFNAYYGSMFVEKTAFFPFGLKTLDYIDILNDESIESSKEKLNIPTDSVVITCGYASVPEQNHLEIIRAIVDVSKKFSGSEVFLFPLTYGNASHRNNVKKLLSDKNFQYRTFDENMTYLDVARLRRITDVMINIQDSDQLAESMLEHMYTGGVIIAGSWLPYNLLFEKGAFLVSVDSIRDVGTKLDVVLGNINVFKKQSVKNIKIVDKMGRWDTNIEKWIIFYNKLKK